MSRHKDSHHINLRDIFVHVQRSMLDHLSITGIFEHSISKGAATEQQWIDLFNQYLPERYRASNAFVVDASGRRSCQIDIAVYDRFYSPVLFNHPSGIHLAAESVYAVFEVKQLLNTHWVADAGRKAASVRALRRTSAPVPFAGGAYLPRDPPTILAGVLAVRSVWPRSFADKLRQNLLRLPPGHQLDLGCALQHGAFESVGNARKITLGPPQHSLIFFFLRLLQRLRTMGNAPAVDLDEYARCLYLEGL